MRGIGSMTEGASEVAGSERGESEVGEGVDKSPRGRLEESKQGNLEGKAGSALLRWEAVVGELVAWIA